MEIGKINILIFSRFVLRCCCMQGYTDNQAGFEAEPFRPAEIESVRWTF